VAIAEGEEILTLLRRLYLGKVTSLAEIEGEVVRVLYVDSDEESFESTRTGLEGVGFDIEWRSVASMEGALEALSAERPDCVVTAYSLSERTGIQLIEAVRRQNTELPVILFTDQGSEEIAGEAIRAGCSDYVPIQGDREDFELLARRIESLAGKPRSETAHRNAPRRRLKRANRQLTALIENTSEYVYIKDRQGHYRRMNEAAAELFGIDPEEAVGKHDRELFDTESAAEIREVDQRIIKHGEPETEEVVRYIDGEKHTLLDNKYPYRDADGNIVGIMGISRDISERTQRENELKQTNKRLESLIDAAPLTIMEIDGDGEILLWNRGAEEMFGWSREAVVGEFNPIVPEDKQSEFEEHRRRALNGERIRRKEIQRETKDGEQLTLSLSVAPVTDSDGTVSRIMAVLEDITEQKQLENRLRSLQETARQLSAARSAEEIATIAVDAAVEILGFEITGVWEHDEHENALVPVTETAAARELFGDGPWFRPGSSLAWEAFESGELRVYDDIRTEEPLHNSNTQIRSEILVPLGEYGLLTTGSTSKQVFSETDVDLFRILGATVEAALARASREEKLQQQNERLDQFTSVVAHDLRNPLSVARGFLEVAEETGEQSHFERIESAHARIERLIDDLLTLARTEADIENAEQVHLGDIAADAWEHVDTGEATLCVPDEIPVVAGAPGRLTQLFENLFRNAVEHGGADVTVTLGRLDDGAGFYVEDDGSGIPPEKRESVFDHGVNADGGQTSFGLSIVADIAKVHGWDVCVTEGDDGGARFEFNRNR
jgi:PAS domain S-box-containing protein